MTRISTLGPHGSDSCQAALSYKGSAEVLIFNHIDDVLNCVESGQSDYALIPVYNTREGEIKEYFRVMAELDQNFWVDNIVLPIHLSLGGVSLKFRLDEVKFIYGRSSVLNQCEDYISRNMVQATRVSIHDVSLAAEEILADKSGRSVLIDTEEVIAQHGLKLIDRELAAHNRTRFALIGPTPHAQTGYDATSIITKPLADRVGHTAQAALALLAEHALAVEGDQRIFNRELERLLPESKSHRATLDTVLKGGSPAGDPARRRSSPSGTGGERWCRVKVRAGLEIHFREDISPPTLLP